MKPGSFVIGEDGVRKPNMEDEAMAQRQNPPQSPFTKGEPNPNPGIKAGDLKETVKEVKDAKAKSNNTVKD